MKLQFSLLISYLILTITTIHAATKINGRVYNLSGEPIQYASVQLFRDSVCERTSYTDSCGIFTFPATENPNPRLRISSLGYKSLDTIIANTPVGHQFVLQSDTFFIDCVTVTARIPQIEMKNGILHTNVKGTPLEHAGTVKDVLKRIPLIHLDNDDIPQVFGRGTPAIYINGRQIFDLKQLNQLQSGEIRTIDVITTPGAQYNSEITSVIKITTIKKRGQGFSGAIGTTESYDNHYGNYGYYSLNYRSGGLEIFGEGNHSISKHAYITGNDQMSENGNSTLRQNTISDRIADMTWASFKIGACYNFSDSHSTGISYNFSYWRKYEQLINDQEVFLDSSLTEKWHMAGTDTTRTSPTHNINIYYTGTIRNINIDFNTDYFERDNLHNFIFDETGTHSQHNSIHIHNTDHSRMWAERLILSYRTNQANIDFGQEYTNSRLTSTSTNNGAPFDGASTKTEESNLAPFIEIKHNSQRFSGSIGLRYEHVNNIFKSFTADRQSRRYTYNDLFPSLSASWKHRELNISLNFTNKSSRPTYAQLSDILEYSTRTKYWRGNPELRSEKIYNIQLSASWKYIFTQTTFTHTRNPIFQTYEPYENSSDISLITYRNFQKLNTLNGMIGIRHTIGLWTPDLAIAVTKQWHKLTTHHGDIHLSHPMPRIQCGNTLMFPHQWQTYISYDFTGSGDTRNHSYRSRHSFNISLIKTFINNDLTVRFDVIDLFDTSRLRYTIYNNEGNITCLDTWPTRTLKLSVSYNFNTSSQLYRGIGAGQTEKSRF